MFSNTLCDGVRNSHGLVADSQAFPNILQQAQGCGFDKIQNVVEPVRTAVIRVRHIPDTFFRREAEEHANTILSTCWRYHGEI